MILPFEIQVCHTSWLHFFDFFYEQSTGLVHDDCITKMRLMSLLDLSSHCYGEVPYSAITSALQINDDEVEQCIVKAIVFKILNCRVDQLNQTVIVRYSCH